MEEPAASKPPSDFPGTVSLDFRSGPATTLWVWGACAPAPERKSKFPSWVAGLKSDSGVSGWPGRVMIFFWAADLPAAAEAGKASVAAPTVAALASEPFRKERRGDLGLRIDDLRWKRLDAPARA